MTIHEVIKIIKDMLGSEEDSLGTGVKCDWCGEAFEGSELQQTSIGMLCDTCIRAIRSRGENI